MKLPLTLITVIAKRSILLVTGLVVFANGICLARTTVTPTQGASSPLLRIETGMHGALINAICADANNRFIVTGSTDSTCRVWDANTGGAISVLRPPSSEGNIGQIYAVAISPNGTQVVCGGETRESGKSSYTLYVFDRTTNQIVHCIETLPSAINSTAFSPDGQFLAVALSGGAGLRIFRTFDWSLVAEDEHYQSSSYALTWAIVAGEFRLATTCLDRIVRLYKFGSSPPEHLQPAASLTMQSGRDPYGIAFTPDGSKIAIGIYETPNVLVVSGKDLTELYQPDISGVDNGNLFCVAWSSDSSILYAGGKFQQPGNGFVVRSWTQGGQGSPTDTPVCSGTILALQSRPAGGIYYSAGDPAWGAVQSDGTVIIKQASQIPDYRDNTDGLLVSQTGGTVAMGLKDGGQLPVVFSLSNRTLQSGTSAINLAPPITSSDGLDIQSWRDSRSVTLNGNALPTPINEMSRCVAISPDHSTFVLGTENHVNCFDQHGSTLWSVLSPSTVWAVNIAGNGKVAIAACADGTIRWYRMSDGNELCSLFPHTDGRRWVIWTRSGYYDCSMGGEDLIGWQLTNGPASAADFFPASRFRSEYYRPKLLASVLGVLDDDTALRISDTDTSRVPAALVSSVLPPVITIISPDSGSAVSDPHVEISYNLRTPSGDPATTVKALIDGRPAGEDRDLRLVSIHSDTSDNSQKSIVVQIPPHDCLVSLIAQNRDGTSAPCSIALKWRGSVVTSRTEHRPSLYVLAVGISKYNDTSLTLGFPDADASSFAAALLQQRGALYSAVDEKVLLDANATKSNIQTGLAWIDANTTQHDVAIIFLAGHGANDENGNYLFIPDDFDMNNIEGTGLPFSDIKMALEKVPGKALLFVDSCHSGNVLGTKQAAALHFSFGLYDTYNPASRSMASYTASNIMNPSTSTVDVNGIVNDLSSAENGIVVFAASTGNQVALEDPSWGHGAFTKALLEGLSGRADLMHTGSVTVDSLDLYISQRVKDLTKGAQTPTTAKPQTVPDFPVAIVR